MSTLLNNKLKLDIKAQDAEVAKFISTTENAEIVLQPDYKNHPSEYAVIGTCIEDPSSNVFGITTYIGTQDKNRIAAFNVTNSDLTTTTIIRGNLLITGSALSLGTLILNDETEEPFKNVSKSAFSNLISERYTSLLASNITNTCNIISDSITNLHQTLYQNVANLYTLSKLFEGISFTTFTDADFDAALRSKTLDNIPNGEVNKYIQNRTYPSELLIHGNVTASNIITNTVNATEVRANYLYGDGSQLLNLNKGDGTTSGITEGSNLFYKTERVIPIIEASNIHASNYVLSSYASILDYDFSIHHNLSNFVIITSNHLYEYVYNSVAVTSNTIQVNTQDLDTYLYACNLNISNISSNFAYQFSNLVDTAIYHLIDYIQSTSNQISEQLVYDILAVSNFTSNTDIIFSIDLATTSNTLSEGILAYSNALIDNINTSEQNAILYALESSNILHNNIIVSVLEASNYVATTFQNIYSFLDTTVQSLLADASVVQTDLTAFLENSNAIQNTLNTNTSNAIVLQILSEMHNIDEYTIHTDALLSNLIMTNYEMTSNNIEVNSNYIVTEMDHLLQSLETISANTSNYILNTSNDIIHSIAIAFDKQMDDVSTDIENVSNLVAARIDALTCDEIIQGTNKYFGSNMFFDNIRTLTLDNLFDGTHNKYIVNGVYSDDLTVTSNLYASNLSIIGNDTVLLTNMIATDALQILSSAYPAAFSATQMVPSKNILEAYDYQSNLIFAVKPTAVNIGISNVALEPKDIVKEYIYYQFMPTAVDKDTSGNSKSLTLSGASYILEEGKNSLLISAGQQATIPSENWNTFNDLSISGWFKIDNLANTDKIVEFLIVPLSQRYPRQAINNFTFTYTDGSGVQVNVKASSSFSGTTPAWNMFDKNTTSTWHSGNHYQANNGLAIRTSEYFNNDTSFFGEWIMIDLGEAITLESYRICPSSAERSARDFRIYATNDSASWNNTKSGLWVLIDEKQGVTDYLTNTYKEFTQTVTNGYRYFALIVNRTQSNNAYQRIWLNELDFFGKPSTPNNISILNNNNQLVFQINNSIIYQSVYIQNSWNHITWNIKNLSSTKGYIKLNNDNKQFFDKVALVSGSYTNRLGSATNTGSLYVSDFRIITTPLTSSLENILYTYIDNTYQLNVFGSVNATSFIGSGLYLYDVNLTDKTTSELAEDPEPNSQNKYFTDARAAAIIDASNIHMSNLIANVSNLLVQRQNTFIASESNYWQSSSNNIVNYINVVNGFQSNLIASTSNALVLKAQQFLINNNQSNYVLTTSNEFISLINRFTTHTSNYVLTTSNALANLNRLANINNSNYILSYSNSVINVIVRDRADTSNYIMTASNALFQSFMSLDRPQSNYTSNISNLFVNSINAYRIETSNYILSVSNFTVNLFRDNNVNTSNYVRFSSNMTVAAITDLINNPVLTGQGQTQNVNYINRWQEPSPYLTTTTVNSRPANYLLYQDGNVGIGTNVPTATLDIFTTNPSLNSVKVSNDIWAQTGVVFSSDARIKKDIVDIDDGDALAKIMAIQPKIYDYVDNSRHRNKTEVYGFIAQQIAEVIPNAISLQTEAIPNIYTFGTIYNKVLMINDEIETIKEGMKLAVLFNNSKYIIEIEDIYTPSVYAIDNPYNLAGAAFIYGTVVDDFHTIDKNYIYALNVCATQDLHRRQLGMQSKLAELQGKYNIDIIDTEIQQLSYILGEMPNNSNAMLSRYAEIQDEYMRLRALNEQFANIVSNNVDYNTIMERVRQLRENNERLRIENEMMSSNNTVLRGRVQTMSGKISSIRYILQKNNII